MIFSLVTLSNGNIKLGNFDELYLMSVDTVGFQKVTSFERSCAI